MRRSAKVGLMRRWRGENPRLFCLKLLDLTLQGDSMYRYNVIAIGKGRATLGSGLSVSIAAYSMGAVSIRCRPFTRVLSPKMR